MSSLTVDNITNVAASRTFNILTDGTQKLLGSYTASNDASVDIFDGASEINAAINSTYKMYIVDCISIVPATDLTFLWLRLSNDAGSSFESSNYQGWLGGTASCELSAGTSTDRLSNVANEGGYSGRVFIFDPSDAGNDTHVLGCGTYTRADNASAKGAYSPNIYVVPEAIDGIQFLINSGNITSGLFKLYGVI
tara:strand:- start:82 stop:663 length:582 start_codon:yes stop_codon:yes gene_type:complete